MADVGARLAQAQLDLREAQNARDAVRRQILGDTGGVKGADDTSGISVPELDSRIETQKRNLDSLLQRYTDQHPDVLGARRVLKDLEEQRKQQVIAMRKAATSNPNVLLGDGSPGSQDLKRALATADGNVATLSTRVAEFEARMVRYKQQLKGLPEIEKEFAQLNRDYDINKKNYEGLVARRESATMSGELEAASGVADFRLIDPPRVSPKPVAPNRLLLLPGVLLASLLLGAFASFSVAQFRPVFFDGNALREMTGLPLLGRVSYVGDPATERLEKIKLRLFFGLLAALIGMYCVGILILFIRSGGLS
jgi:polysaccharide chain length determinant protein (PEP-CTERM system associated)